MKLYLGFILEKNKQKKIKLYAHIFFYYYNDFEIKTPCPYINTPLQKI